MIVNQNRGSYGMFSRAGRNSTEKYHILMKKDDMLKGSKKNLLPDVFSPNENDDLSRNDIDNFNYNDEISISPNKIIKNNLNKKKTKNKKKISTKYDEIINKNKRLNELPCFNKYNPKNDYIWKKTVQNQDWEKSVKKSYSRVKKEEIPAKFYLDFEELKNLKGKNFIDLEKQTERKSFANLKFEENDNDNISKNRKLFSYDKNNQNILGKFKSQSNFHNSGSNFNSPLSSTKNDFYSNHLINTQDDSNMNKTNNFSNSLNKNDIKASTGFSFNGGSRTFYSTFSNNKSKNKWVKIQAPDFKKLIPRESDNSKIDKSLSDKNRIIPFGFPSVDAIKTRRHIIF